MALSCSSGLAGSKYLASPRPTSRVVPPDDATQGTPSPILSLLELALAGISVSSTGVRGVWSRHGPLSRHNRLLRLEKASAERAFTLSEEQIEALERFSPEFRERHIVAHHTGDLLAVDTFFVGRLKGVGKIYRQSAVDCCVRYA